MINKFVSRFLMLFKQCCFLYGSRSKIQCKTNTCQTRGSMHCSESKEHS